MDREFYNKLLSGDHDAVLTAFSDALKGIDTDLEKSRLILEKLEKQREEITLGNVDAEAMMKKKAIDYDIKQERVTLNKLRDMQLKWLTEVGVIQQKLDKWEGEEFLRVIVETIMLITFKYIPNKGEKDKWVVEITSKVIDKDLKQMKEVLEHERKQATE